MGRAVPRPVWVLQVGSCRSAASLIDRCSSRVAMGHATRFFPVCIGECRCQQGVNSACTRQRRLRKSRPRLSLGLTQPEIAKKYRVSRSLVSDIATGRAHKDVRGRMANPRRRPAASTSRSPTTIRLTRRIMELEAEVVHLTEERNRERAKVKAGAKIAGLFKAITKEMDSGSTLCGLPAALDFGKSPDRRALRPASERRPPRSGREARGGWRLGKLRLPGLLRRAER